MAPLSGQLTRSLKSGDQRQLLARRRGPAPAVPRAAIRTLGVRKLGPHRRTEIKSSLVAQRLPMVLAPSGSRATRTKLGLGRHGPEVLLYWPILKWGPPLDQRLKVRSIGFHSFLSFEFVLPEERPKGCLAGTARKLTRLAQKPLAVRSPIVQNGPAWSCLTPPRHRVRSGKYWPVKSAWGKWWRRRVSRTGFLP